MLEKDDAKELLIRLDERWASIQSSLSVVLSEINAIKNEASQQSIRFDNKMKEQNDLITKQVKEMEDYIEKNYVKNDRFEPVKNVVYGVVALIITAVIGALLSLIIKN